MGDPADSTNIGSSHGIGQAIVAEERHSAASAERIEEAVFGVLDGVITSIALVVAVAYVIRPTDKVVFLTVLAATLSGGISMFVGALLSARTRANLILRERAREKREVIEKPDEEWREVFDIYRARGFTEEEATTLTQRVTADQERWIDTMMRDELGMDPKADPAPLRHGLVIGLTYLFGGAIPALPFAFGLPGREALYIALGLGGLELATVGILQAQYSGTNRMRGAGEILLIGVVASIAVFLVTYFLQFGV